MIRSLTGKRPAFLLCDIQERFRTTIHLFPAVVHTAKKLITGAQLLDCPLVVTEQYPKALGNIVTELNVGHAVALDAKTRFSMCTDNIHRTLVEELKADSVVLFGIESHVCVLQTALELRQSNLNVFVVADGVSSGNKTEIPIALERMKLNGCIVTTSDSLLFEIMGDAKHPKFKEISALLKKSMESDQHNKLLLTTSAL